MSSGRSPSWAIACHTSVCLATRPSQAQDGKRNHISIQPVLAILKCIMAPRGNQTSQPMPASGTGLCTCRHAGHPQPPQQGGTMQPGGGGCIGGMMAPLLPNQPCHRKCILAGEGGRQGHRETSGLGQGQGGGDKLSWLGDRVRGGWQATGLQQPNRMGPVACQLPVAGNQLHYK